MLVPYLPGRGGGNMGLLLIWEWSRARQCGSPTYLVFGGGDVVGILHTLYMVSKNIFSIQKNITDISLRLP